METFFQTLSLSLLHFPTEPLNRNVQSASHITAMHLDLK